MSKIKRIISVTLSILLFLSSVPILASAATPVLSATATEAGDGEEITITVSVSGFTGAECGVIYFTFDPEVLEFVSITGVKIEYLHAAAGMLRDSSTQLSYSFMWDEYANVDSTELVYLTFIVLNAEDTTVTWTCDSWGGVDTPAGGSITIAATEEPTTEEPTTEETREQTSPDGYLTYVIEDGARIIDCNTSISGAYTIPDTLGGYPVISIETHAFEGCKSLENIILPDSLRYIFDVTFAGCTSLKDIVIPDNVTIIGINAFAGCTSLKSVTIPDSVTELCGGAFADCTSLESITIPYGVTYIPNNLFAGCTSLTSVTIPDSVTEICGGAFADCTSLTSVTIPASVTSISTPAFGYTLVDGLYGGLIDGFIDNFIIYGYNGTAAETYANENGITFIPLDESGEPITEEPTTEEPTSEEPITEEPTTAEPTTAEPTTAEPTTEEPITEEPITEEPTTEEPTTEEPTTEEPTTAELTTEKPTTAEPTTEETTTEEPTTAEPTTEEPTTAEPTTEEPTTEEPTTEEPTTEEPTTAEPTTEEPIGEEPTTSAPEFTVSDETVVIDESGKQITISAGTSPEDFAAMIASGNAKVVSVNGEELTADDLIGTGCKVQTLDESGNVISEYTVIVPSDVDGNGKITAADARITLRTAAQLDTLDGVYVIAADFDADSAIKPSDARSILRVAAKLD